MAVNKHVQLALSAFTREYDRYNEEKAGNTLPTINNVKTPLLSALTSAVTEPEDDSKTRDSKLTKAAGTVLMALTDYTGGSQVTNKTELETLAPAIALQLSRINAKRERAGNALDQYTLQRQAEFLDAIKETLRSRDIHTDGNGPKRSAHAHL